MFDAGVELGLETRALVVSRAHTEVVSVCAVTGVHERTTERGHGCFGGRTSLPRGLAELDDQIRLTNGEANAVAFAERQLGALARRDDNRTFTRERGDEHLGLDLGGGDDRLGIEELLDPFVRRRALELPHSPDVVRVETVGRAVVFARDRGEEPSPTFDDA